MPSQPHLHTRAHVLVLQWKAVLFHGENTLGQLVF